MVTGTARELDPERIREFADTAESIRTDLAKRIVGLSGVIEDLMIALLSGGHCLLVGVPGLAKTLLIQSLSELVDLSFRRIQFTPDLMPSDIVGTEVLVRDSETGERAFRFMKGPVFANIILADEINRTPPKTQAALMEAMEERQVTSVGERYPLEAPFFVLATQNPIEQEGTYPLPAAQLDRFLFNVWLDYPDLADEARIVRLTTTRDPAPLSPRLSREEVLDLLRLVRAIPASPEVLAYGVDLARRSRPRRPGAPDFVNEWVAWGGGPRAAQALVLGGKARALLLGRSAVLPGDLRAVAQPVFRHRMIMNFQAEADGVTAPHVIRRLVETTPAPDRTEAAPARPGLLRRLFGPHHRS
jgi:MoxR-like ATPase